jgi:plasmid stabilization system protein ParE
LSTRTVIFAPEAQAQLLKLYRHIADVASPEIASRYTAAIIAACDDLQTFPIRGVPRDDIQPGLRVTNYRKNTAIAFSVSENVVSIVGIFYGGQNYESALQSKADFPDKTSL